MNPRVGPLIAGRYQLGPRIGNGGMSDVHQAHDNRLDRPVAVKLMRSAAVAAPDSRRRFEDEARAAAQLVHPHVVTVFDYGNQEGTPFIVMERLPGRTLADEIARGPLSLDRACHVIGEVLAALQRAYNAGIVHRDIKPGNILLTADGEAKVADFGIAKAVESSATATATGALLGTPAYLAPERVAGQPATVASDVYAVGVVLYEALTGTRPFAGDTPLAVMRAIEGGRMDPIERLRPDLPAPLKMVLTRALARNPRRRFRSAGEMLQAMTAVELISSAGSWMTDDLPTVPFGAEAPTATAAPVATETIAVSADSVPTQRRTSVRARSRRRIAAGAIVALVVFFVVTLAIRFSYSPAAPSSPGAGSRATTSAPGASGAPTSTLAPALSNALDALDEAVRP